MNQLAQVKFYSNAGTTILPFAPGFSAFTGGFGEIVLVPEPSGVAVAIGLLGLIGWREGGRNGKCAGPNAARFIRLPPLFDSEEFSRDRNTEEGEPANKAF